MRDECMRTLRYELLLRFTFLLMYCVIAYNSEFLFSEEFLYSEFGASRGWSKFCEPRQRL